MSINELYHETEYKDILFYMSERGFSTIEDLSSFDFEELFFVPGVSEDLIESAKTLFMNAKHTSERLVASDEESAAGLGDVPLIDSQDDEQIIKIIGKMEACCEAMQQAIGSVASVGDVNAIKRVFQSANDEREEMPAFLAVCDEIASYFQKKIEMALDAERKEREVLLDALDSIPVESVFRDVNRGSAMISYCRKNGILTLSHLMDFDFENTRIKGLGKSSMAACEDAFRQAVNSYLLSSGGKHHAAADGKNAEADELTADERSHELAEHYRKVYYTLDTRARECLLRKAHGETLQEIGDSVGLTRERVRQIILKTGRKVRGPCTTVLNALINDYKRGFYTPDIKAVFSDADELESFAYAVKDNELVHYLDFADKYVPAEIETEDIYAALASISHEMIGDIVNYYNIMEDVEEQLIASGIPFIDAIDFMGYLLENGYRAIGDYIVRNQSTYKRICYTVIEEHFKNGIKLDGDPENQDINRLKEIVKKEFSGFSLDQSSRALTARLTPDLILCGRGRYIAEKNVVYDEALFEEIVDYINGAQEPSFYYSELFTAFSGRLYAETSVDNANYLHGMLKYLYPDTFRYERDLLVKLGKKRVTFAERLSQMIREKGGPVSKAEIDSAFPGVTDIRLVNAMVLDPQIIQWEYHQYNHIDNIQWDKQDYDTLAEVLESLTASQNGYCSEKNLYDCVCRYDAEFIQKNGIQSSQNVFYIAACLLMGKYRFSRPHIAGRAFPDVDLNNIEVAKFFLRNKAELDYRELVRLSEGFGWASGALAMILNAVEKDYVKTDLNSYIAKEYFEIASDAIESISHELQLLTGENGYYGIFAVFAYDRFPDVGYEWNEHLLQSIIENYPIGFRILEPKVKDRRYRKGIIVPENCECTSYEDLIISQMQRDGISRIGKDEFSGYLRRKGLVLTANIPIELYEGDGVRLEGNYFVY